MKRQHYRQYKTRHLESGLYERLRRLAARSGWTLELAVNHALRRGVAELEARRATAAAQAGDGRSTP